MHTDPKPTERERLRLLADRLCYLSEGMDGLRARHGMQRAYGFYYVDAYDTQAQRQDLQPGEIEIGKEKTPLRDASATAKPDLTASRESTGGGRSTQGSSATHATPAQIPMHSHHTRDTLQQSSMEAWRHTLPIP